MSKTLSSIAPGKTVKVTYIETSDLKPKLMEMGVVKGKFVTVLFKAPFGDPIAVDVHGYILSLRLEEAALIQVDEVNEQEVFA